MSQVLVTIKKADGSIVRVPLSEFKKMQAGQKQQTRATHHAAKSHPVHLKEEKKQHPAPRHIKPMSRADAGSLLEEKIPAKGHGVLFNPKREKQVEMVISKLGFNVAPDLLGRLKSLVLARLKDIKSEDEARELLSRSVKNGGLGLTEPQVEKVLRSCREAGEMEHGWEIDAPSLKGKTSMLPMVEPSELPMVISPPPLSKRGQGELPKTALGSATSATPSSLPLGKGEMTVAASNTRERTVAKIVNESMVSEPVFKLNTQAAVRKSMQDISASAIEMGPVEEIKSTTLTDFRRLSGNPEEAARRLQQKMFNLQDESFVLYLDALAAYRASPLYGEYMRAVCQSLAERKSLANVLAMKNGIKLNEVMAIVEMERTL